MKNQLKCIKCNSQLKPVAFRGVEIDRCENCGGLWLDKGELKHLWNSQGEDDPDEGAFEKAISELAKMKMSRPTPAGRVAGDASIVCPSCTGKLTEVVFDDTHIEQCAACDGVYLDAGELAKAMALLDTGEAATITALAKSMFTSGEIG